MFLGVWVGVTFLCRHLCAALLNEEHFTFRLQYKHSGTFANLKYEDLSYPQKSENVRPHSGNSIETATPSSGTPQLASYKEVPPGLSAPALRKDTWGRIRVCALNDPRNDVKMNKTQMKPQATGE